MNEEDYINAFAKETIEEDEDEHDNTFNPDYEVVIDLRSIRDMVDYNVTDGMIKDLANELNISGYVYDQFMDNAVEVLDDIHDRTEKQ